VRPALVRGERQKAPGFRLSLDPAGMDGQRVRDSVDLPLEELLERGNRHGY
jgi:hypothetical protein